MTADERFLGSVIQFITSYNIQSVGDVKKFTRLLESLSVFSVKDFEKFVSSYPVKDR